MDTRGIRVYSYNGMEWNPVILASFNVVSPVMSDGDCGVYDDVASYSSLYSERSDFFHH